MSELKQEGKFTLPLPFCCIQALSGLDEAHPRWGGRTSSLSKLIQVLISSRSTFYGQPERMFYQSSGHPLAQSD